MKVAFIVSAFPVLYQTFVLNQITGLLDLGHEVHVCARRRAGSPRVHPEVSRYRLLSRTCYMEMPAHRVMRVAKGLKLLVACWRRNPRVVSRSLDLYRYGRDALSLRQLYQVAPFLGEGPYHIVHCHFGPSGIWGARLRELGLRMGALVTTFYGYDVSSQPWRSSNGGAYGSLFGLGDLFISISDHMTQRLISLGCPSDRIVRHPLGVDLGRFEFSPRNLRSGDPIRMLTVARLTEKKGVEYSVRAAARVIQARPDRRIEYRVVGDGPLRAELQSLIDRLGVPHRVSLLGSMIGDEIRELYNESHLFMLSSVTAADGDQEGTPMVLMEAQATGLPVVSTLHAGIPEIVQNGESGFLVPERDTDALADKLGFLVSHPEIWPRMGAVGRRHMEEHHDVQKLNRRLVTMYEALLATRATKQ